MHISNFIGKLFWRGLFTLLPLYLTVYFVVWLCQGVEQIFAALWQSVIGEYYITGLGLLTAIALIWLVGLFMQLYVVQYLRNTIEKWIKSLPVVGDLYSGIRQVTEYVASDQQTNTDQVVMVTYGDIKLLGLVTRDSLASTPLSALDEQLIAVYLPMSYQIGGFTVYCSKDQLQPISMSQQHALKWTLMAGVDSNS